MKRFLIPGTVVLGLAGISTMASAEQSANGSGASYFGKALGKGWGGFVSDGSKATNSGKADGDESTIGTLPVGGLPFQVIVSDPGAASTFGTTNKGSKEE